MKSDNIIRDKSYNIAIRIINLHKYLNSNKKEFILSKQILKSGTSIGANIEEAIGAQSNYLLPIKKPERPSIGLNY